MKTKTRKDHHRFRLRILPYGNSYYIDRVAKLEKILARTPRVIQIELVGVGEIPADTALRIRAALLDRSVTTRVVTHAQSSLQNSSVLVWLLGDTRLIRNDARVFFRRTDPSENREVTPNQEWTSDVCEYCDSYSEADPEEGDYARVLECIDEYLPVREMAGRLIGMPVLRQFGLVDNAQMDQFLATALAKPVKPAKEQTHDQDRKAAEGDSHPVRPSSVEE